MTKILWATNSLGLGGAERQITNMASILKQKGFEVDVVYYSNKDTRMLNNNKYNFNTIFINKDKIGKFNCLIELNKLIRKNKYNIIHAFGGGSANFYIRYAAFFTHADIVIGAMLGKKHFSRAISRIVNSIANLRFKYWTVNNIELIPILMHDLKFVKKQNVFLLNNGYFDRNNIDYKEGENIFYDKLKGDDRIFVTVGRLAKVKNIALFINSAIEVLKLFNNVQFWIIGDGPRYNYLQNLIKNNNVQDKIKMLGYRSDVNIALSRADFYTLTSYTEGSPNAMAEAMRAKKPLISTKCTSLKQFIIEYKNGIIVDVNNKNQLVMAMKYMLSKNNNELSKMGEISYKLFRNNFEINKVAEEFSNYYDSLLERKRL